jgi:hypothetical protein
VPAGGTGAERTTAKTAAKPGRSAPEDETADPDEAVTGTTKTESMDVGTKTEAVDVSIKAEDGEDEVMSDKDDQKPTIDASDTAVKVERDEW